MKWAKALNNYEVSDDGRIRNASTKREVRQFQGKDGYMRTQVAGKTRLVHRIVASAFIPIDDERPFVNHKDGNKSNNSIDNLEWVTKSENQKHAFQTGLRKRPSGMSNSRSRLSSEQVTYIRKHYKPRDISYGAKAMAAKFGVAHQTICAVVSRQNWKE